MTTDIERQFFETFGIEPKHNDGCEISDRYWANEENADKYITFDNYMNTFCPESDSGACFATCPFAYYKEEYPQITDRILLELICIGTQFFAELVLLTSDNIEDLKEQVLIIYLKTAYKEKITRQVRTLFKEG